MGDRGSPTKRAERASVGLDVAAQVHQRRDRLGHEGARLVASAKVYGPGRTSWWCRAGETSASTTQDDPWSTARSIATIFPSLRAWRTNSSRSFDDRPEVGAATGSGVTAAEIVPGGLLGRRRVPAEPHQRGGVRGRLGDGVAVGEAVDPDDERLGRPEDEHGRVVDGAVAARSGSRRRGRARRSARRRCRRASRRPSPRRSAVPSIFARRVVEGDDDDAGRRRAPAESRPAAGSASGTGRLRGRLRQQPGASRASRVAWQSGRMRLRDGRGRRVASARVSTGAGAASRLGVARAVQAGDGHEPGDAAARTKRRTSRSRRARASRVRVTSLLSASSGARLRPPTPPAARGRAAPCRRSRSSGTRAAEVQQRGVVVVETGLEHVHVTRCRSMRCEPVNVAVSWLPSELAECRGPVCASTPARQCRTSRAPTGRRSRRSWRSARARRRRSGRHPRSSPMTMSLFEATVTRPFTQLALVSTVPSGSVQLDVPPAMTTLCST